ncbi:MAG: hemolysin family protein [Desulfobacterales bacterium]
MTEQVMLLVFLLVLSGFFSSSETALFSISKTKARHIAKEERKTDILIERMKEDPHRLLSTILIGNNVVNVGAAALATSVAIGIIPNYAVGIATGVMTLLVLVFGEVLPKSIATRNNIVVARLTIYPIYWLSILFYPIIAALNFIPRITGRIKKIPAATEAELRTFVEVVEEEGEIKEEERELIDNIFEFDDTSASEIMTPRTDMFVIRADETLDLGAIVRSGFTRVPVIEQDVDHVIGIINIKDIFLHQATSKEDIDIRKVMREPYFVPENKKLDTLLQHFKKGKHHMAIVVDEHGGVSGLITLEDALEELVGEITDETDRDEPLIVKLRNNEWIVLGKSEIDVVNETVGMDILDSKEYDTFSGYILDKIGRIPDEKEEIAVGTFVVGVDEMEGNRIKKFIVRQTLTTE